MRKKVFSVKILKKLNVKFKDKKESESKMSDGKKEEKQLIETIDEEGKVVNFELFDIVDFEDQEYALLLPVDD